jgi:bifunctional DNase/RNase
MFPYGLAIAADASRPVMIFKDKSEEKVLPVWLSPLDAGIAVSQSGGAVTDASPHNLTWKILKPLGVKLEKCFFTELKGHHQYLRLEFSGSDKLKSLESRADEAMSFCLSSECRFFCRKDFIDACRTMDASLVASQDLDLIRASDYPYLN